MKKYELPATDGRARRGRFTTPHGVIETPVFMNVGTVARLRVQFLRWIYMIFTRKLNCQTHTICM